MDIKMDIKSEHVFQWYSDNIQLIRKVCWKAKDRSDCGNNITFDDLMGHCIDKIVDVFKNYNPEGGTKLSTFVMLSLRFECMKHIARVNKLSKRYKSYERVKPQETYSQNLDVKYIEQEEFTDSIFCILEKELSKDELRIYILRQDGLSFSNISDILKLSKTKVQNTYWSAFYKARKLFKDEY